MVKDKINLFKSRFRGRADVLAFISVCRDYQIPFILERSQFGYGAHVWMFFSEPVLAKRARDLGAGLITLAMQHNDNISMDSYDRLFPSQDTLPKGGYGNLIALPLQGARRKNGNSSFLDDKLQLHPDQ